MALAIDVCARILLNLVDFGIQDCLDYVSLNLFSSSLKPHIRKEVMHQASKVLDDAFDMAVQSEKINFTLPVMPVDQSDSSSPADESEADLLAALEDLKADNKRRVVAVKAKLSKLCCPGQSSSNC
jgi:hypothetical protein